MRLFQNSGVYPSYLNRLDRLAADATSFSARRSVFLHDRFGALHFLKPVLDASADAFFTNGDDAILQRRWASEQGLPSSTTLEDILLAQIESHRTEIFYNLDPLGYSENVVSRLPASVKKKVCWRAAPSGSADLSRYDAVLGNFPSILEDWRRKGCRVASFSPAIDPVMSEYGNGDRPVDVIFVGGYSRHHMRRAKVLEAVAELAEKRNIVFCLDMGRLTKLAESPIGLLPPLRKHRRPSRIRRISHPAVFGRDLYKVLGQSKIVLNGAIDMAGNDRGNMRCFEAMGCGALLVSDAGHYPHGMQPGLAIETYDSPHQAIDMIERALDDVTGAAEKAARGRANVSDLYSKTLQWQSFIDLVARL